MNLILNIRKGDILANSWLKYQTSFPKPEIFHVLLTLWQLNHEKVIVKKSEGYIAVI